MASASHDKKLLPFAFLTLTFITAAVTASGIGLTDSAFAQGNNDDQAPQDRDRIRDPSTHDPQDGGPSAQQGSQDRNQTRMRDPSTHNEVLQERWRNKTEMSGVGLYMQHLRSGAPTIEQYPSNVKYILSANGTATSLDNNDTENVSVRIEFATWKSNNRIVSMDILNGTITIGDREETVQAGHAYYLPFIQMLRIYGLVQYEAQDGQTYVKMLRINSIPSSVQGELPTEDSDQPFTFDSSANSRLDAEYRLNITGQVVFAGSGPVETNQAVTAAAGEEFTVELESNPSTGYEWQVTEIADEQVVRLVDSEYVPPESDLLGASGKQVFTFEAVDEGSTRITLEYARAFEDSPIARHVVDVTVGNILQLTTDKPEYGRGETVTFTATNHGSEGLIFPGSALGMEIMNQDTGDLYSVIGTAALTPMEPGESRQVTWQDTGDANIGNYITTIGTVDDEGMPSATAEASFSLN
jgi:inhibitor of cysteine peptidase